MNVQKLTVYMYGSDRFSRLLQPRLYVLLPCSALHPFCWFLATKNFPRLHLLFLLRFQHFKNWATLHIFFFLTLFYFTEFTTPPDTHNLENLQL